MSCMFLEINQIPHTPLKLEQRQLELRPYEDSNKHASVRGSITKAKLPTEL